MEAVRSSEKLLVCQTCGDEGFKNAYIYCSKCLDFAIHRYCLKVMPKTFEEHVNWCCESCKVKSSQSQKKEAEISGQIEAIHLMKRREKWKHDTSIKAGTNEVNCQDNITDSECEYIDLRKWLFSHHIPKKKCSNRKKIAACLTAKRKDDKLLCVLMADSELDKTGNHECQDKIGTNVSQSADFENNLQDNCNRHAQPVIDPIWRGSFNILGKNNEKVGGFVAHLSNKACTKDFKEAITLPSLLRVKMHPNSVLWPKSFGECDASDDNVSLYFFPTPRDPINEKAFDHLVSKMMDKELAMRTTSKNAELLIFTSLVLHPLFQRYQKKYYLWGIFKSKQNNPTSEHPPLDVKGMPTRMKALDVVSPRSPLGNNERPPKRNKNNYLPQKVDNFRVGDDHFVITMAPYHIKWSTLQVPVKFARSHGLINRMQTRIVLEDEVQRTWPATLKTNYGARLSGWVQLKVNNHVEVGDMCMFKIVKLGEVPVFNFYNLGKKPIKNLVQVIKETNSTIKTRVTQSDRRYFISTMKSYFKKTGLHLPQRFSRSNGLKAGEMVIRDDKGRSWKVKLVNKNDGNTLCLRFGFNKLCKENGLREGDAFKFELVENQKDKPPIANFSLIVDSTPSQEGDRCTSSKN